MKVRIAISMLVPLILAGSRVPAQGKPGQPCITPACHASFGKAPFVHGPVAANDCSPCHILMPNKTHNFEPVRTSEELCTKCHEPIRKVGVVHKPVLEGRCTGCHSPHQASQRYMLRGTSVADMCFGCHSRKVIQTRSIHAPVAEGECLSCHAAHASEKPKLLSQSGDAVCFECHSEMKERLAAARRVHKPLTEGCIKCHNPHGGNGPALLAQDLPEQCLSCHSTIKEHLATVVVQHKALEINRKCLNCHSPHEAQYEMQLDREPMPLCLSCHDKKIATPIGEIEDMKALFAGNPDWHGPIRDKDCSGCHDVHGSQYFRLLRFRYPKEFYAAFAQEQYELCFVCHEPTLVQDSTTTTLTNFRDGDRNLHYLHVNKKVKGRTCRSCHETHASQKPRHIRETVPFGQWSLPIRFEKRTNGGTCSPGCHAAKEYTHAGSSVGTGKK